ncbi:MAG: spore germination protein [Clostridiaceae bacterium]|nr:spore germination protein [Clostridiaceae bacterium]
MLEELKKLFVYRKPSEHGFRFPEDPRESELWSSYRGKKSNLQDNSEMGNNSQNNKENREDTKRNKRNKEEQIRIIKPMPINELVVGRGNTEESREKNKDMKKNDNAEDSKTEDEKNDKENNTESDKEGVKESIKVENTWKEKEHNKQESGSRSDKNQKKENSKSRKKEEGKDNNQNNMHNDEHDIHVSRSIEENINILRDIFNLPVNQDVIIREFIIARRIKACIVFIDGMIDKNIIIEFTLPQLMNPCALEGFETGCPIDFLEKNVLSIHQVVRMDNYKSVIPQILSGLTVVFIDGCDECLVMESRGFEKRDISVPSTETVINGSQEAFTENLRTNITLIRRIVKNESLITEFMIISKTNNILAALLYIDDITNKRIVEEVKRRVEGLDIDYIAGSGMLEQLIEDKSLMLFPQIISTERPDRVASFLMDGKVALVCEGTPFALAMPITFFDLFHTSEDSNLRWQYGTFLRIVRLIGTLLSLLLPGLWTALILFHQEMIPTSLLSSIVISRAPVPFQFIIELLLMELSFELIREGGIRVPGITGNTLGIIGALILGQSAVSAGLVSPSLIIVVAVTGLGSFTIPNYSLALAVRIARFILIGFGAAAGLYGLSVGFTIFCALALGMKSFGVPFFTPIAPKTRSNQDRIIRGPFYKQEDRPDYLNTRDEKRMGDSPRRWVKSSR